MKRNVPFWLVWNLHARVPTHVHPSRTSAVTEAERLANMHPGQEFYVLPAISCSKRIQDMTEVFVSDDPDISF